MSDHSGIEAKRDDQLRQVLSSTMSISPEIYEKIYLAPQTQVKGDLRKTFGNPTPVGLLGFVVGLTPISAQLMGWRGSGGGAAATTAASLWFGGLLLLLAGLGEWILGNTFPFVVFLGYGAHFLTFATTSIPWFNAVNAYAAAGAAGTAEFEAGFGFYTVSMTILSFIFLVGSLRTNLVFFLIFICATAGFGTATGAEWQLAQGYNMEGSKLWIVTGAFFMTASLLGWYMLLSVICAIMEIPYITLPVVDLSTHIRAKKPKSMA